MQMTWVSLTLTLWRNFNFWPKMSLPGSTSAHIGTLYFGRFSLKMLVGFQNTLIICLCSYGLKEQISAVHFKLFRLRMTPHLHNLVWTHSVEVETRLSINTAGEIVDVIYANRSLIVDESCFTKEVIKEQFLYYMEESTCFPFTHSNSNYHPWVLILFLVIWSWTGVQ